METRKLSTFSRPFLAAVARGPRRLCETAIGTAGESRSSSLRSNRMFALRQDPAVKSIQSAP